MIESLEGLKPLARSLVLIAMASLASVGFNASAAHWRNLFWQATWGRRHA